MLEATEAVAKYVRLGKLELTASSVLERLGFPAARQWTPVGQLSGGERRRLQLTRLLMAEPNVLLLDEPTNDLDVDTLAHLEDLLDGWPGTLVVVSHDRYLVERVCDTVVALLGDGKITHLPGGIDEYLARRAAAGGIAVGVGSAVAGRRPSAPPDVGSLGGRAAGGPQGGRSGWSGGWRRCRPARRSCTRRWPRPPPTRPRLLALDAELRGGRGRARAGRAGVAGGRGARRVVARESAARESHVRSRSRYVCRDVKECATGAPTYFAGHCTDSRGLAHIRRRNLPTRAGAIRGVGAGRATPVRSSATAQSRAATAVSRARAGTRAGACRARQLEAARRAVVAAVLGRRVGGGEQQRLGALRGALRGQRQGVRAPRRSATACVRPRFGPAVCRLVRVKPGWAATLRSGQPRSSGDRGQVPGDHQVGQLGLPVRAPGAVAPLATAGRRTGSGRRAPRRCSSSPRAAPAPRAAAAAGAAVSANGPRKLLPNCSSNPSAVVNRRGGAITPALFSSMSTGVAVGEQAVGERLHRGEVGQVDAAHLERARPGARPGSRRGRPRPWRRCARRARPARRPRRAARRLPGRCRCSRR